MGGGALWWWKGGCTLLGRGGRTSWWMRETERRVGCEKMDRHGGKREVERRCG